MKLIKPSFEIIEQQPGLEGIYKQIEQAGRTCYKSEDKITENSARSFADRMLNLHHGSVLEHGTIYLKIILYHDREESDYEQLCKIRNKYVLNPYSVVNTKINEVENTDIIYITTNLRVLCQGNYKTWSEASKNNYDKNWIDDLAYICEPEEEHEKRVTVHFVLSRSTANEFVRHRVFSFSQESQRYCNYSADKFNNEVTFIEPCWTLAPIVSEDFKGEHFLDALENAEKEYLYLVENGWKPQQAREVLPNACKTELVMTGFVFQWAEFFGLRCASNAHPQAQELAIPLREEFVKRGYLV